MSITLAQTILATTQCMTNEDAIDFIEEHISPGDLAALLDEMPQVTKLIPGCGYTKALLYRRKEEVDDDG